MYLSTKAGLPLASSPGVDPAVLAQWVRELSECPWSSQQVLERVCRPLSQAMGGVGVWIELGPLPACGFPTLGAIPFENGDLPWVPRRIQRAEGTVIWLPLHSGARRSGWLAFAPDGEQLKALGSQRLEAVLLVAGLHLAHLVREHELSGQVESRDRFLAIASHELKTPLTAIFGMVQLQERLLRTRPWPELESERRQEQERHLSFSRIVLRQLERLTGLIDGLLDLSRIRAGRFVVEPIPVDAARAVREIDEGRLRPLAHEAGVELVVDVPDRLPARLDPLRFDEVVTNLVMNGIRRSPEGAQVRLEAGEKEGTLWLKVSDQGSPVPAQDRERCFEPFSSTASGPVSGQGGLGLGLYIARQIARLHEGEVRFLPDSGPLGNTIEATFWKKAA